MKFILKPIFLMVFLGLVLMTKDFQCLNVSKPDGEGNYDLIADRAKFLSKIFILIAKIIKIIILYIL